MTVTEVYNRQFVLRLIPIKRIKGALKAKLILMLLKADKAVASLDDDRKKLIDMLKPEGFDVLSENKERTEEEEAQFKELCDKLDLEFKEAWEAKLKEEYPLDASKLTEEEFGLLVENIGSEPILSNDGTDITQDLIVTIANEFVI